MVFLWFSWAAKDVKSRHLCPHGGPNAARDLAREKGRPRRELNKRTLRSGWIRTYIYIYIYSDMKYETIRRHGLNIFSNPRAVEKELAAFPSSCPETVTGWVQTHPIVYRWCIQPRLASDILVHLVLDVCILGFRYRGLLWVCEDHGACWIVP